MRSIFWRRAPRLLSQIESLGKMPLTQEKREELREVLCDEFTEVGLREDYEPTDYGKKVDDLIGVLGFY